MSYLSFQFAFFVLFLMCVYYLFPARNQWMVLLTGSTLFYLSYHPLCLLYFLYTAITTYGAARLLERYQAHKQKILAAGIALNVLVWLIVKDYNSFAEGINGLFEFIHLPTIWNLLVPVGISYYVLQSIGYLVDVYRGHPAEHRFFRYALFLGWFPAIVQGPISRYEELSGQLFEGHRFDFDVFREEMLLILYGVIKKMVIADNMAKIANYSFRHVSRLEGFSLYWGILAYSIQLYMDFSGCVDICRGVSGLFGIRLRQNFAGPYFSRSIKEFWGRWHLSLSSWLRDYIYIPLGGNRKGKLRKYANITIVFLVSGLWHGTGIVFLIWGLLHAVYQILGEVTLPMRTRLKKLLRIQEGSISEKIYQTVITFHLVAFAWIFFRAPNLTVAFLYIKNLFSSFNIWVLFDGSLFTYGVSRNLFHLVLVNLVLVLLVEFAHRRKKGGIRKEILSLNILLRWIVYFILIYDVLICGVYGVGADPSAFLYGGF